MIVWLDRRVWGLVQKIRGPNVVGPFGLLQTFLMHLNIFLKRYYQVFINNFILAPIVTMTLALDFAGVIPMSEEFVLADKKCWYIIFICSFVSWCLWNYNGRLGL